MAKIAPAAEPKTAYSGTLTDSRQWQFFRPRIGDIIVSSPPKSGTTWVQGILALLIAGDPQVNANPSTNAPWIDTRFNNMDQIMDRLDAQSNQRQIKTHTPLDGIPIWEELRYITVYRHPIDVHFSARTHVANYRPETVEDMDVDIKKFPDNPRESFRIFIEDTEQDHGSLKTIVNHFKTCLEVEPKENILRLHYADMKSDLESSVLKIAEHVGISHPRATMKSLIEAATFNSMKSNANRFGLAVGKEFWRDDTKFFDSATSNKWEGVLTEADLTVYDEAISHLIKPKERSWLEWGSEKNSSDRP